MQAAENTVVVLPRRRRIGQWFRQRLAGMLALDTRRPRAAIAGLWLVTSLAAGVSALGLPTGFGTMFDVTTGVALNTIAMPLAAWVIAVLLALVGLRLPRFAVGSALYSGVLLFFILLFTEFAWLGAVIYAVAFTLIAAGAGLLGDTAIRSRRNAVVVGGSIIVLGSGIWAAGTLDRPTAGDGADRGEVQALATVMENPSELGEYLIDAFTYGSGADKRRSEFGQDADEVSQTVDASAYIEGGDWVWLRTKFWGFDESSLPLNGRVWMPQGEGPFPVVLMVHGNHLMEQFSDEGYGYLGELLASRGVIAISVDENFLNFSAWSGIPDQDMKLRAWMLLKHIGQLQQFAADTTSRFYGKIDFRQIALIGHSRGGQAVAMAADRVQWFSYDAGLPLASSYQIKGVVAIAPTDTYVDGRQAKLHDISYLTLQGAKDADLVNFNGDRQYSRVDIAEGADAFKTSLYIAGANHSQFNTAWGEFDNSFPGRLFVRPTGKLEPGAQRQIAKTYVSAFMETLFHKDEQYRSLFRDYRTGLRILPSTAYYSQYQDGQFRLLADYEGDDRARPGPQVSAEAVGLTDWRHIELQNRQLQNTGDQGLLLKWDAEGTYSVRVASSGTTLDEGSKLAFSIARLDGGSSSNGTISIKVKDRAGVAVSLPLSRFADVLSSPPTDFTWLPWMEAALSDGKFAGDTETVYQTVELSLSAFEDEGPDFTPSEWEELTLRFDGGPGSVLIDDLGLIP